jgi:hypothetical protein
MEVRDSANPHSRIPEAKQISRYQWFNVLNSLWPYRWRGRLWSSNVSHGRVDQQQDPGNSAH